MVGIKLKALEGLASLDNKIKNNVAEEQLGKQVVNLSCDKLIAGRYQPRTTFDEKNLIELRDSIKINGIIQPLIVRRKSAMLDIYEIIAGERRWRAAKQIGLKSIPAIIHEIDNETALAFSLIENIQREDLNPIDQAISLSRLKTEFFLTHEQIGERVGWSRSTITNSLRLLELDKEVVELIRIKQLSPGHGKLLLALLPNKQREMAAEIIQKNLSVRVTEAYIQKTAKPSSERSLLKFDELITLQAKLKSKINKEVKCTINKNRIKAMIFFDSMDDLEEFINNI